MEIIDLEERKQKQKIKPSDLEEFILKGVLFLRCGRLKEGIEFLDKFLENSHIRKEPEMAMIKAKILCIKGLAYEKAGELEKAIDCYTEAIKADHKYVGGWFHKGCIYFYKLNKIEEAMKYYEKALEIAPELLSSLVELVERDLIKERNKTIQKMYLT